MITELRVITQIDKQGFIVGYDVVDQNGEFLFDASDSDEVIQACEDMCDAHEIECFTWQAKKEIA